VDHSGSRAADGQDSASVERMRSGFRALVARTVRGLWQGNKTLADEQLAVLCGGGVDAQNAAREARPVLDRSATTG